MVIKSSRGYNIFYEQSIPEHAKTIILAMHGFTGNKESDCITILEKELNAKGIGLVKFDWPAHGQSDALYSDLRIENCLSDLNIVIEKIKQDYSDAELIAFATSFGGYLTLLYNYEYPEVFKTIILRSPAIKMYNVMAQGILKNLSEYELNNNETFTCGVEGKIKITNQFLKDLKQNNAMDIYKNKKLNNIYIIHGTNDIIVPITDSIEFSEKHNCQLYTVMGAGHGYKNPKELERVVDIVFEILNQPAIKAKENQLYIKNYN